MSWNRADDDRMIAEESPRQPPKPGRQTGWSIDLDELNDSDEDKTG